MSKSQQSPIIPRGFLPFVRKALEADDQGRLVFILRAIMADWDGETDRLAIPAGQEDLWMALKGHLDLLHEKQADGRRGGRPKTMVSDTENHGFQDEKQNSTEQNSTEQNRTEQSSTEQNSTETDIETLTLSIPPPIEEKPRSPKAETAAEFARFWDAYGKKVGRATAEQAFAKARRRPDWPGIDAVVEAVAAWRRSEDWSKENGQFQPHASTWLNQRRWEDEPPRRPKTESEIERERCEAFLANCPE